MAETKPLTVYPCSRCNEPMEPHIVFVRVGYNPPIDLCRLCSQDVIEFAQKKITRLKKDTKTISMFDTAV